MKRYIYIIFLFTGCTLNRAQIDKDLDAVSTLESELLKPIEKDLIK